MKMQLKIVSAVEPIIVSIIKLRKQVSHQYDVGYVACSMFSILTWLRQMTTKPSLRSVKAKFVSWKSSSWAIWDQKINTSPRKNKQEVTNIQGNPKLSYLPFRAENTCAIEIRILS